MPAPRLPRLPSGIRPAQALDFDAARKLPADFGAKGASKPDSDLKAAYIDANWRNMRLEPDGTPIGRNDDKVRADTAANMHGLFLKAKKQGISPDEHPDQFGDYTPPEELGDLEPYMMNPFGRKNYGIEDEGALPHRTHASIAITNGQRILDGLYGDDLGGNIGRQFLTRNRGKTGQNGLLNLDPNGPEAHLFSPAYILRGDADPKDASAYWDRMNRYAYFPTRELWDDFVVPHEAQHLHLEGRDPDSPNPLQGLPTWDDIRNNLNRDIPSNHNSVLPWFLQRWSDPEGGRAELIADWSLANRTRSAIRGNPSRGDDDILRNLYEGLSGHRNDDTTIRLGPRSGRQADWNAAIEDAMRFYWMMERKDGTPMVTPKNKDTLMKGLLDSGSTQDGHPRYPDV